MYGCQTPEDIQVPGTGDCPLPSSRVLLHSDPPAVGVPKPKGTGGSSAHCSPIVFIPDARTGVVKIPLRGNFEGPTRHQLMSKMRKLYRRLAYKYKRSPWLTADRLFKAYQLESWDFVEEYPETKGRHLGPLCDQPWPKPILKIRPSAIDEFLLKMVHIFAVWDVRGRPDDAPY
ncbi:hypothetical protein F503_02172 [Ophiostoma piceae UAMH 11346]|uniref:Uncharacterized protein n=1 Tax=Ophiostoma piceae (strain UAMH 11346) TaxID=1262450 RepID=S3CGL9_OPHP1|nr:hypothetical protein F503_02172 [Ophiostoma piceae UAMH 11346]